MRIRHANLYDVERWRRNRTILLLPATVFGLVTLFTSTLRGAAGSGTQFYSLVSAFLYAGAAALWTRRRLSYLGVEGDQLLVRVMFNRVRIPLTEVRQVRVAKLRSKFGKPERRRVLPRPKDRWLEREALIVRLEAEPRALIKLTRLLGARCLDGRDLVVPVANPRDLAAEIEAARPAPEPVAPARRGRRRR